MSENVVGPERKLEIVGCCVLGGHVRQHHKTLSLFVLELLGSSPFAPDPSARVQFSSVLSDESLTGCVLFLKEKLVVIVGESSGRESPRALEARAKNRDKLK